MFNLNYLFGPTSLCAINTTEGKLRFLFYALIGLAVCSDLFENAVHILTPNLGLSKTVIVNILLYRQPLL